MPRATESLVAREAAVGEPASAAAWRPGHLLLLAVIGVLLALHRAEAALDTDVLWSARYGADVTHTGHLPHSDTYSWTAHGHEWIPSSWGWNVLLGIAYRLAGVSGMWVLGILISAGLGVMIGLVAARIGAAPLRTAMVFAVLGIFALVVIPRAQAVGYLVLLAFPLLLPDVLFGTRSRALRAAAIILALQIVWMNLHTVAVVGPVVLLAGGGAQLIGDRRRSGSSAVLRLLATTAAASLACLATPYGTAPITHIPAVRRASVGLINEWDHAGIGNIAELTSLAAALAAIAVAVVAWRGGRYSTAGILIVLAAAAASAVRFGPMTIVMLIPELARGMGKLEVRPFIMRRAIALGCGALVVFIVLNLDSFASLNDDAGSPRLVAELPSGCRLLNDYTIGGAVILKRHDVPVSIDSRNDMYGRRLVLKNEDVLENSIDVRSYVAQQGVTCVLAKTGYKAVQILSTTPGWKAMDHDSVRTLLVRQ